MAFCYNCGAKVDDDNVFCSECGCRLREATDYKKSEHQDNTTGKDNETVAGSSEGYIFTNMKVLAEKLSINADILRSLIEKFIKIRQQVGINYTLIDASNYKAKLKINRGFFSSTIQLTPADGWQAHQRMLMDRYFYDTGEQNKNVEYLFIIGSDDVIPMPSVGQHSCRREKSPILSDLPYSHLYGDETEQFINDNSIFHKAQMLYVGRLPLADNAAIDSLITYINNIDTVTTEGIYPESAYAQCDPHWKMVTSFVAEDLYATEMMLDYSALDQRFNFNSVLLTPFITRDNVDQVFNTNAWLYLFNMHGSDHPHDNDYHGAEVVDDGKNGTFYSGLTPKQLQGARQLNVVVAEPCFGAKPNKRKRDESILISAVTTKTVLFFGSTHVAWGAIDPCGPNASEQIRISCADIMAKEIMRIMIMGYPAGMALLIGKMNSFNAGGLTPNIIDTCLEFNLFGDPSLTLYGMDSEEKSVKAKIGNKTIDTTSKMIYQNEAGISMKTSVVYDKNETSMLNALRNAVDRNLMDIQETINRYLYNNYNISPRQLNRIVKVAYSKGYSDYVYHYSDDETNFVVTVDEKRNIKNVVSSK